MENNERLANELGLVLQLAGEANVKLKDAMVFLKACESTKQHIAALKGQKGFNELKEAVKSDEKAKE